jgi:tRNA (Thr-GGU) A37 N-methylase
VLTWLHLADRAVLQTHPTGDPNIPLTGVFRTRSPDRPKIALRHGEAR